MSDHLPVFVFTGSATEQKRKDPVTFKYRKLDDHSITAIKNIIKNVDWTNLDDMHIDSAYKHFIDKLRIHPTTCHTLDINNTVTYLIY